MFRDGDANIVLTKLGRFFFSDDIKPSNLYNDIQTLVHTDNMAYVSDMPQNDVNIFIY